MGALGSEGDATAGKAALHQTLNQLTDDREFDFELRLTRLAAAASTELIDSFRSILIEDFRSNDAYAALYASHIYFRRMKEHTELRDVMARFGDSFRDRPTYPHLSSMMYALDPAELDSAVSCADAAKRNVPRHAGVLHNFAVVTIQREERRATPDHARLETAEAALDTAIAETHGTYGKYHATYARLLALKGEYARAEEQVDAAIDREEPTKTDYAIRIGDYQAIKLDIKVRQSLNAVAAEQGKMVDEVRLLKESTVTELERVRDEIDTRMGEARAEIDTKITQARADALQILGLLAAVVAFVVSVSSISAQLQSFAVSGRLFVTVAGAILVIYAGFNLSFLQPEGRGILRSSLVFALGIGIGAFALFGWHVT